jgi:hypothetical protein
MMNTYMSKYFLDLKVLNLSPKDDMISSFLRFVSLAKTHKLYGMYSSGDNIVVQIENQNLKIGKSFIAKSNHTGNKTAQLLSLNCGNYESSPDQLRQESRYRELQSKLISYIYSNNFGNLHLQDLSDDPVSFKALEDLGYTGFWIPNLIYSEGKIGNTNSGVGSFFNGNLEYSIRKLYVSLHQGNLPNITNYTKNVDAVDLITVNCSVYQAFINDHQKTIQILANTYISPFSRTLDRLENILQTVKNIKNIKSHLLEEYPDYDVFERLTGDMNIYGVNALHGPLGLKASPWSFGLPLLSSLVTDRNLPNERELAILQKNLDSLGYKFVPENNPKNQTIFIEVEKHAPNLLKPLFKNKKVGWQLDICIVPKDEKVLAKLDVEPFGDFDHSSLTVS